MTLVTQTSDAPALVPAALAPFVDADHVAMPFPLYLPSASSDEAPRPLGQLLDELASGTLLRENLRRFELMVRRELSEVPEVGARAVLSAASARMLEQLKLAPNPELAMKQAVEKLVAALDEDAVFVAFGPDVAVQLAAFAASRVHAKRYVGFRDRVKDAHDRLQQLLAVEESYKAPTDTSVLGGGGAAHMVDASALASLVGTRRGTQAMEPARRARLEELVAVLGEVLRDQTMTLLTVVHSEQRPIRWTGVPGLRMLAADDPCAGASVAFDDQARALGRVFGALRAAQLELADAYKPELHDGLRAGFGWTQFTEDELLLIPPVVALISDHALVSTHLTAVSRLLASEREVQVLVELTPSRNPGAAADEPSLAGFRVEPGYLALAHRQAFVQQGSVARPQHLFGGLYRALECARPGVHLVDMGTGPLSKKLSPWVMASAAVESRALPLFRYDPVAGESWAECMDVSENPAPHDDWAAEEGEFAFTFAHYALLDPAHVGQFRVARDEEQGRLMPIDAWLDSLDSHKLPVVWAHGEDCSIPLVPSDTLLEACIDRRRAWRALQELGGYSNPYALRAAAEATAKAKAEAEAERQALIAEHEAELARVRREAASEAMQRLASVLLNADLGAMASSAPRSAAPAPAPVEAAAPEAAPEAPAAAPAPAPEPAIAEEPWIDSPLCTSCNDCMQINAKLFIYNDNKQACIGDPGAGSFAEVVLAAEKCPSRCIHPGSPMNPNEAGLAELIARAAPFQ